MMSKMMGAKESMSLISIKGQKAAVTGQQYWRSLDHLAEKLEFRKWVEQEFPAGASEMLTGASRRHMMKIMAATARSQVATRRSSRRCPPAAAGEERAMASLMGIRRRICAGGFLAQPAGRSQGRAGPGPPYCSVK